MNKKLIIIELMSATVFSSCVSYTKIEDEVPTVKKFQSGETARVFYEAIFVNNEIPHSHTNSLSLTVGLPISWHKYETHQKRINVAFRSADLDKSGRLSFKEAQSFAESESANN